MDAKTFFDHFGLIASAPNGVEQLRGMILQLAIQGKFSSSTSSWITERLSDSIELISGQHLNASQQNNKKLGSPYVTGASDFGVIFPEITRWTEHPKAEAQKGDVLLSVKGTVGKVNLIETDRLALGRQVMAIRSLNFTSKYLFFLLRSLESYFLSRSVGISVPGINRNDILTINVERPPREEQDRIVATVERLLGICDRLEALNKILEKLQERTSHAVFLSIAKAKSKVEFQKSWDHFYQNYEYLYNSQASIQDLKHLINYLHVRGVAQFEEELTKPLEVADKSISIPDSWHWANIADVKEYVTSGSRGWKKYFSNKGDIFIQSQDIKNDKLEFSQKKFVDLPSDVEGKRTLTKEGDLLVTITGANVGRCAVMPKINEIAYYVSQHIALVRLKEPSIATFLHLWVTNNYGGRLLLLGMSYGDKPGLNLRQISMLPVPLPPKEEIAKKIVSAANSLEVICTKLEGLITKRVNLASKLLKSSVQVMTGLEISRRETMKAPKTEVITELFTDQIPLGNEVSPLFDSLKREGGKLTAKALWQASDFGETEINPFYQQLRTEIGEKWIKQGEITVQIEQTEGES